MNLKISVIRINLCVITAACSLVIVLFGRNFPLSDPINNLYGQSESTAETAHGEISPLSAKSVVLFNCLNPNKSNVLPIITAASSLVRKSFGEKISSFLPIIIPALDNAPTKTSSVSEKGGAASLRTTFVVIASDICFIAK